MTEGPLENPDGMTDSPDGAELPGPEGGPVTAPRHVPVPDDGGAPILSYTVTANGALTTVAPGSATSAVVTGLTNGVSYTFTVHATNSAVKR